MRSWQVTPVIQMQGDELKSLSVPLSVHADARGVVDLTPLKLKFSNISDVLAKNILTVSESGSYLMHITYTGRVWVWCNGKPVFMGPDRGWDTPERENFFGGRLIPDEFEFLIFLNQGANEIQVHSKDPERWGWGFWSRVWRS
jgi:hypothetical protein